MTVLCSGKCGVLLGGGHNMVLTPQVHLLLVREPALVRFFLMTPTKYRTKQLQGGRFHFGSHFQVAVHCSRQAWRQACEVLSCLHSGSRDECWCSVCFFSFRPGLQPRAWCHPHSGWLCPPHVNLSGNCLAGVPRCLLGDPELSQAGPP